MSDLETVAAIFTEDEIVSAGATTTSSVIASKICFQEAAKPPSMADVRAQNRHMAIQHLNIALEWRRARSAYRGQASLLSFKCPYQRLALGGCWFDAASPP
jgi:hypothetical protein